MNKKIAAFVREFDGDVERKRMTGGVKWTNFFKNEEAIVSALKEIPIKDHMEIYMGTSVAYKGYEYIHSFAKRVQGGKELSDAQMRQAKRIASEIKKAWLIRDMWEAK